MDTNTNSQSITNNQLVYLVDLEEKLKEADALRKTPRSLFPFATEQVGERMEK